ncbi:hypothetical protein J3R30DRAFT_3326873 [Lentinula aciculospora]|uniref:rRNA biogenesis protein RRP36 n=1 Tax=Lentinula aciculospora TaxID=153920 RepID=A0A9W9DUQ4_9AGAR|nr:hypothetical protein J3R30DRAFT_3326873 [Lentinula aciculospora]
MPIRPSISTKRKKKEQQSYSADKAELEDHRNNGTLSETDEDEANADAPRVAQWVDEDALNDDPNVTEVPMDSLASLETDLSSLPMGALRQAQNLLKGNDTSDLSDNDSEPSDSPNEKDAPPKSEWSTKSRSDIRKRQNKHAPIEITSKKPVTRRRTVVNVQTPQARDPRFLPMTGEFSSQKFNDNYQFLNESHKTELSTLRENLKRARKLLVSSPRDTRHEREAEVKRLELALKKAESTVNKDRRDATEQEALRRAKKEERKKQESGKGKWFMKESEKKELLVRARYDAIAEQGGQRAVKKSIEKKRKKIAQKEKKSRPFPKGGVAQSRSSKRPLEHDSHDRHREKRRKVA